MLSLICQIYPNKKPSDYLNIKDDYTAFALDGALALRVFLEQRDREVVMQDNILNAIYNVCRSLGADKIPEIKSKTILSNEKEEENPLMKITPGTVFVKRK
jgi:hypothetical protein